MPRIHVKYSTFMQFNTKLFTRYIHHAIQTMGLISDYSLRSTFPRLVYNLRNKYISEELSL